MSDNDHPDHDVGWFRDEQGLGVMVTHTRDGCVLGFPARPGATNEYLGTVPHDALDEVLEDMGGEWRCRGSYEQFRARIRAGRPVEEW